VSLEELESLAKQSVNATIECGAGTIDHYAEYLYMKAIFDHAIVPVYPYS
jgi:hypothetical protein